MNTFPRLIDVTEHAAEVGVPHRTLLTSTIWHDWVEDNESLSSLVDELNCYLESTPYARETGGGFWLTYGPGEDNIDVCLFDVGFGSFAVVLSCRLEEWTIDELESAIEEALPVSRELFEVSREGGTAIEALFHDRAQELEPRL